MKIENQVCTLEQAKKLFLLGIHLNSQFSWCWNGAYKKPDGSPGFFLNVQGFIEEWHEAYCAFLGSEITVAINWDLVSIAPPYKDFDEWVFSTNEHDVVDKNIVVGMTDMLIYLLENNQITAQEVNERLNNA